MVGTLQKLVRPTGFEAEQRQAQREQDLADKFLEQSQDTSRMYSPLQALAKIGAAFAASRLRKKSDSEDTDVTNKITDMFNTTHAAFQKDVASGMSDSDLQAKYGNNQFAADDLKPHTEALVAGMKKFAEENNTIVHTPQGWRKLPDIVGKQEFNPQDKLIPDIQGNYHINTPLVTADQIAQGGHVQGALPVLPGQPVSGDATPAPQPAAPAPSGGMPFTPGNIGQVESGNRDFLPSGQPVTSPAGAMYGMQVMPSTARQPGYGVPPVPAATMNLPATDPRRAAAFDQLGAQYAQAMQRRFGALGPAAYNAGPGRVQSAGGNLSALPQETQQYAARFAPPSVPTSSTRPPDAQTKDGRPVWYVNGVPFDNPEGN